MKKPLSFSDVSLMEKKNVHQEELNNGDIAIIGMSAKFSLADNYEQFWMNIQNEVDAVRFLPKERMEDADRCLARMGILEYSYQEASYLDYIDKFDYHFFNMEKEEACAMDPHHRLFLESAVEAIEDAGYGGENIENTRTGIYIAYKSESSKYYQNMVNILDKSLLPVSVLGNKPTMIYGKLAYNLNLRGAGMLIDTACSTSLTALHTACRSLQNNDCDMALVAAVKINYLPIKNYEVFGIGGDIGIESTDARTRTFDDEADGTGNGEGVATLLLKPLEQAKKDGDHIHAVIKGSFLNQDGASIGLTAPNPKAHEDVIINAWKDAGVDPLTIAHMEAHGTATRLGDPIEIDGIKRAFSNYTKRTQFCAISSIKSNLGHCDNVAGLAGVIKSVLALEHKKIPGMMHFHRPNQIIDFINSPLYVSCGTEDWEKRLYPRRCGVSSFGISGTNSHVVLEEWNDPIVREKNHRDIFTLCAKSEQALLAYIKSYKKATNVLNKLSFSDICYTANIGRGKYPCRLLILAKNSEDFYQKLKKLNSVTMNSNANIEGVYFHLEEYSKEQQKKEQISSQLFKALCEWNEGKEEKPDVIALACQAFVMGMNVNWNRLYQNEKRKRVPLPTYPFEKLRCWINISGEQMDGTETREETVMRGDPKKPVDYWKVQKAEWNTGTYVPPTTNVQIRMAEVWCEVLGHKKVGLQDNFFETGGNSKKAAILTAKMQQKFSLSFSLHTFLENPTIEKFSKWVEENVVSDKSGEMEFVQKQDDGINATLESGYFYLEHRNLLNLFCTGKIEGVEGAALVYMKNEVRELAKQTGTDIFSDFFEDSPMVSRIYDCKLGRFAVILLPIYSDQVYIKGVKLKQYVLEGLHIAKAIGAKTVSMAGMLPSALEYGKSILEAGEYTKDLPEITTGHATTVVAITFAVQKILSLANRILQNEVVGFLGMGSIGSATLKLMLLKLAHPAKIILCDIYMKKSELEMMAVCIREDYGFQGEIEVVTSSGDTPELFYEASMIIGATNVADVLQIGKLKPGTILVDDTSPHCFPVAEAIKRFEENCDILFSEGGVLNVPFTIKETVYLDKETYHNEKSKLLLEKNFNPHNIMGCIFSSLLTSVFEEVKANIGEVKIEDSSANFDCYKQNGFQGSMPHCEGYWLELEKIKQFAEEFGTK